MLMRKGDKNLEKDGRKKEVRQEQVENSNKNFEKKLSRKKEGNTRATKGTQNSKK